MSLSTGTQTLNGRAFEYALSQSFQKATQVKIDQNSALSVAKHCFDSRPAGVKNIIEKAGDETALFLQAHDKNIRKSRSIYLQDDSAGKMGDVRDIIIRVETGEVGLSAKYNHTAIKHSRLSKNLDFGKEWTEYACSKAYFSSISPIFSYLDELKLTGRKFSDIARKDTQIYLPVLTAFQDEMKQLCEENRQFFVGRLFKYLLGKHDFYKIILNTKKKFVTIQPINIDGTLAYGEKWKVPDRIESINRPPRSNNTLIINFNEGWAISFRIHNAKSLVEPSLKFDIQFEGISPKTTKHDISLE